jgi:hypothetical protein
MNKTMALLTIAILAVATQAYASSNVLVKKDAAYNRCAHYPC